MELFMFFVSLFASIGFYTTVMFLYRKIGNKLTPEKRKNMTAQEVRELLAESLRNTSIEASEETKKSARIFCRRLVDKIQKGSYSGLTDWDGNIRSSEVRVRIFSTINWLDPAKHIIIKQVADNEFGMRLTFLDDAFWPMQYEIDVAL